MSEEKYKITIPANSAVPINAVGDRIYCEFATAPFFLNVEGVQDYEMKAKRSRKLSTPLKSFFLENRTGAPNTVELHIGYEELHDNEVNIAGSIQGNVNIVNSPTQPVLNVDSELIRQVLYNIKDFTANIVYGVNDTAYTLKHDKNQRAALSTILGSLYATANNTTVVLATAAANTKGVVIRRCFAEINSTSSNASGFIRKGASDRLASFMTTTGGIISGAPLENFFIPAGVEVAITSGSSPLIIHCHYEVIP